MGDYNIANIGEFEVKKGKIKAFNMKVSSEMFLLKIAKFTDYINPGDLAALKESIDQEGREKKLKNPDEVESMLQQIQTEFSKSSGATAPVAGLSGVATGFGADEKKEAGQSEADKRKQLDSEEVSYYDPDKRTSGIETLDHETGEVEGTIDLDKELGNKGELVPTIIKEEALIKYNFNSKEPIKADDEPIKGKIVIQNPSSKYKMGSIKLDLENKDNTSLDKDVILAKELAPQKEIVEEYTVMAEKKAHLEMHEFVSTINSEDIESYALVSGKENEIYIKNTIKNVSDQVLYNVNFRKEIHEAFDSPDIVSFSIGKAEFSSDKVPFVNMPPAEEHVTKSEDEEEAAEEETEEYSENQENNANEEAEEEAGDVAGDIKGAVVWEIEKLDPGQDAAIVLKLKIDVKNKDVAVRTGRVKVKYSTTNSISGLTVKKFEAVSDVRVGMSIEQNDDRPENYTCEVVFANNSDFMVRLTNCDVSDKDGQNVKFVDIDPNDGIVLAGKARWTSKSFDYESTDEEGPSFRQEVEFFLIRNDDVSSMGTIQVNDVRLAVASLTGSIAYDRTEIPSFTTVDFGATMTVINDGGAPFDELILEEHIQSGFMPPDPEKVVITLNGQELNVPKDQIKIDPATYDPQTESVMTITLSNLKETIGQSFNPNDELKATYPITADKVAKDTTYSCFVKYIGNTLPKGLPIEYVIRDETKITTVHKRRKIFKFKDIQATEKEGTYTVVLSRENTGNDDIKDVVIRDLVPRAFTYDAKPDEVESSEDGDILIWKIENLKASEKKEITYKISGRDEDFDQKQLQVSL